jgi:methionine--tRNA ligase beta chain
MSDPKPDNLPANDFFKFDLRVGTIQSVEAMPKSKKLLKMEVSFGPVLGNRTILAGIAASSPYGKLVGGVWEDSCLVGTRVIAVLNLEPRDMMGVKSHGMLLAAHNDEGEVYLAGLHAPDGSEVG